MVVFQVKSRSLMRTFIHKFLINFHPILFPQFSQEATKPKGEVGVRHVEKARILLAFKVVTPCLRQWSFIMRFTVLWAQSDQRRRHESSVSNLSRPCCSLFQSTKNLSKCYHDTKHIFSKYPKENLSKDLLVV